MLQIFHILWSVPSRELQHGAHGFFVYRGRTGICASKYENGYYESDLELQGSHVIRSALTPLIVFTKTTVP